MDRLLVLILIVVLTSCGSRTVKQYKQLVDRADKIIIIKHEQHDTIVVSSAPLLQNLKEILKRNVNIEYTQKKFLANRSIQLFSGDKRIGSLTVSYGEKPYVNMRSDSLNFTFQLKDGI